MKYTKANNTYSANVKDDPKDKTDIEIGDIKQPDFKPQIKLSRWDNDANFSVRLISPAFTGDEKPTQKNSKVALDCTKHAISLYRNAAKAEYFDEETNEFEVILKEKPDSNQIVFSIVSKNVDFHYQPPLSEEPPDSDWESATETDAYNKAGVVIAHRPENLVGGYAVFHKNPVNIVGGQDYKWGLFGWIFRPRIEDSAGNWTWGKLHIENDLLTVTIPEKFLDEATYPIYHAAGLTFGETGTGGNTSPISTQGYYMQAQMGANSGTCTSLSWYIASSAGSNVKAALYADASTLPTTVLGSVAQAVNTTTEWKTFTLASSVAVTGSALYWFAARAETVTTNVYFATVGAANGGRIATTVSYATFPAASPSFTTAYTTRLYSAYATYTETAATTVIPVFMNQYRQRRT